MKKGLQNEKSRVSQNYECDREEFRKGIFKRIPMTFILKKFWILFINCMI